jgi:hypothetical protein
VRIERALDVQRQMWNVTIVLTRLIGEHECLG